jgi:hypothetical protein
MNWNFKFGICLYLVSWLLVIGQPVCADIGAVLENGQGARDSGMGLAQVAASEGISSVYWNPAGLAEAENLLISSSGAGIYGTDYKTLGMVLPVFGGGLGILVLNATYGDILETNLDVSGRPVATGSTFGYDAKAFYLSYARSFGGIMLGTSLKYLTQDLAGKGASGVGGDIGLLVKPSDIFSIGAKIENIISPQMKWDTSTDQLKTNYRIGASLRPRKGKLLLSGDVNFSADGKSDFYVGGEYRIIEILALRGGFFDGRPSFGVGFDYRSFGIDYSYSKGNDYLEDTHRVSLSYSLF